MKNFLKSIQFINPFLFAQNIERCLVSMGFYGDFSSWIWLDQEISKNVAKIWQLFAQKVTNVYTKSVNNSKQVDFKKDRQQFTGSCKFWINLNQKALFLTLIWLIWAFQSIKTS